MKIHIHLKNGRELICAPADEMPLEDLQILARQICECAMVRQTHIARDPSEDTVYGVYEDGREV